MSDTIRNPEFPNDQSLSSTGGDGVEAGTSALPDLPSVDDVAAALYQNEALYQTFLEQSPVGIAHLDAAGTVTFENYQLRSITGEDVHAAWIGHALTDVDGLDERLAPLAKEMLTTGGAFAGDDFTLARRDGEIRILQVYGAAIQHPENGIVGGVLMVFDITLEHAREAELRVLRRYDEGALALRDVALSASSPHVFLDDAVRILGETAHADCVVAVLAEKADAEFEQHTTWYADGAAGPEAPVRLDPVTWQGLADGDLDVADVHTLPDAFREGSSRVLAFSADGDMTGGFMLVRVDDAWSTTERTALIHLGALFETLWSWMAVEARYRQVVSAVEDSLFSFSFDADGERAYSFATRQMEALTGYSTDDLLAGSHSWRDEIVLEDDRAAVAKHEAALRDERESRLVYRIRTAQGQIRWLRESATPGRDRSGHVVAGILSDVTEAKEAEATLIQAKQDAESATRMKSTFLSTMSHEIRTPLGAISGFADLLLEEVGEMEDASPVVTEFAETIRTSSQKVLRLVNEIFDLASLQSGRIYVDRAPVALHPTLLQVARSHEDALAERGIDLVLDFAEGDPIVMSEARRLAQVAEQLVSNAAKFTESGSIRIASELADTTARVIVSDTGIGIAPDYLDELFEPFSQEDNRLNRNYEGSGLGLAITKRLVEAMNGTIEVETTKGEGTTFTVTLPRADG